MKQEMMTVVSQVQLAPRIYELVLTGELVAEMQRPGQFIHLKVPRADLLLRRPISIAKIDREGKSCTIIYRIEGDGTDNLSTLKNGDVLDVMGPLGNGFPIEEVTKEDVIFVIGGGIGVPPLYELSLQLKERGAKVVHLFGFASQEVMYYEKEFAALDETHYATDDGSFGHHGHVGHLLTDLLEKYQPTAVYACGANGMLKAVATTFSNHPRAYLSLEARMACGMGACYACICHVKEDEAVVSKKVCNEGPIFPAKEVVL